MGEQQNDDEQQDDEYDELYPLEAVKECASIRKRLIERILELPDPEESPSYEHLRMRLWSATRELDHLLDAALASFVGDLTEGEPATRQALYAFVVERCFTPHATDDSGCVSVPRFTPEECKLEIVFQYGRWMATWLKLEEDMSRPEYEHREVVGFAWDDERDVLVFIEI